MIQATR